MAGHHQQEWLFYGGNTLSTRVNTIDYVEIMSGDAVDFGDLQQVLDSIMRFI